MSAKCEPSDSAVPIHYEYGARAVPVQNASIVKAPVHYESSTRPPSGMHKHSARAVLVQHYCRTIVVPVPQCSTVVAQASSASLDIGACLRTFGDSSQELGQTMLVDSGPSLVSRRNCSTSVGPAAVAQKTLRSAGIPELRTFLVVE